MSCTEKHESDFPRYGKTVQLEHESRGCATANLPKPSAVIPHDEAQQAGQAILEEVSPEESNDGVQLYMDGDTGQDNAWGSG